MGGRKTEADLLQEAVEGMTAPQALRYAAQLVLEGGPRSRGEAVAALIVTVARTLSVDQVVVREGLPIVGDEETVLSLREYAVRRTGPDCETEIVPYGDRLFAAVRDVAEAGEGEVLCRNIVVSPWYREIAIDSDGGVQRSEGAV